MRGMGCKVNLSTSSEFVLIHLNNIQELIPYFKENATINNYKDQMVNGVLANNRCLFRES
jgi:hypothetical protein